jgi:uncharacterized protein (TIGR03118 family)
MRPKHAKITVVLLALAIVVLLPSNALAQHYQQTNLVSDVPGLALHTDPDLVNSWGLVRGPTTPWWINDNGTGLAQLYMGDGTKVILHIGTVTVPAVVIPPPAGSTGTSTPTGIAFNGGTGFVVTKGTASAAARFIFATEDGTISAWSPTVDPVNAILEVPAAGVAVNAIYKGLTINNDNNLLYAANFLTGKVDVFDSHFAPTTVPGGFADTALPPGYAPFNVQNINGNIFVTFAKQGTPPDEVDGRGLGFVDKFDQNGNLLLRFQHGPWLNAPWGVTLAPANFGLFSNRLLVGQFGSGRIAAFDPITGEFLGFLHGPRGPLVIDGLWALGFGADNANSGPSNTLFFTAGINDEQDGLFGTLTALTDTDNE